MDKLKKEMKAKIISLEEQYRLNLNEKYSNKKAEQILDDIFKKTEAFLDKNNSL